MDFLNKEDKRSKKPSRSEKEKKEEQADTKVDIDKSRLKNYKDPFLQISLKKLKAGLWYVEHRAFFRKTLLVIFVLFIVGMWLYIITGFGVYIFKGMEEDKKMINSLTNQGLKLGLQSRTASDNDLNYSSITTFKRGDKHDLMVKIKNPEERYWAEFDYCFTQANEEIDCRTNFILPGESKYILSLSHEFNSRSNIDFDIESIDWQAINFHKIPNWEQYKKEHLNFEFTDVKYNSGNNNEYSDKINLNSLKFNAYNNTSYGYWKANVNILLYNSGKIVGINSYTIDRFNAGEKEKVELVWPGNMGEVTDVSIVPDLNIMDKSNYIQPEK
ncbi:MAG: hypothetical protein ACOCVY_01760 [Patescibacteria group bacterium]